MNLIGHRGQDQSAGLIRSDYINHILHGTDVLRKIAKMPKWQSLCFIIYVMAINLVNHENLLNLVVDRFLRFSSVTMPLAQPKLCHFIHNHPNFDFLTIVQTLVQKQLIISRIG